MPAERRGPAARRGTGRGEEAVSPVIGTILVLAISVLGIVSVSNWGLPAIQEMQAIVEVRSVLDQFRTLDATLQQLLSGSAGQTTFKWQPTLNHGSIDVNQSANRWLVAADALGGAGHAQVKWSGLSDNNEQFKVELKNGTGGHTYRLHAYQWIGGAKQELQVQAGGGSACTASYVGYAPPAVLTTLYLHLNGTGATCTIQNIDNKVLTFQINDETAGSAVQVVHVAELADVGHVHWRGDLGQGVRHVYDVNGAILTGNANGLVTQSTLSVPPPRDFTNSSGVQATSMFARLLKVNGTASFSAVQGAEQYSIYLNLAGSYTMNALDSVNQTYVYIWGDTQGAIYSALTEAVSGYRFVKAYDPETTETYLSDQPLKPYAFTVIYSLVTVED
ncbi:MAG: hypothetical protein LC624_09190 [Halobacteriales archaeon]|nr:hypothetical protein [Halobacteriales archaeon]